MREILFRGKPKNKSDLILVSQMKPENVLDDFVLGLLMIKDDRYFICISTMGVSNGSLINNCISSVVEVIPETVGQYTGLTDKNGKKIFKGDICRDNHNIYWIVWNMHGWQCKTIGGKFVLTLGCRFPLWQWDNCKENGYRSLEVIGNIHDNPELFE